MENRRPAAADAAPAGGANRMRWLLLAAGVLVIVLVLVSAARLFAPGSADPWRARGAQTVGQSAPDVQAPAEPAAVERGPALIIDAAAGASPGDLRDNPLAAIRAVPEDDAKEARPPEPNARVQPGGAPRVARPQAANTASTGTRSRGETDADSNLISTLLGIIRQDGGAAAEPSAMDSLVARILAENERTYSETNAALASLGQAQPLAEEAAATASPAQRALQACPAANTVQGINCRDRICVRWAGRDPACPAR